MPKMRTRSAAKKRFKKVGDGTKVKFSHGFRRHLFTSKSSKRKRQLRKTGYINDTNFSAVMRLLPY